AFVRSLHREAGCDQRWAPLVTPPVVQIEVAAPLAWEQERGVQPRRQLLEGLDDAPAQRHEPRNRARGLAGVARLAVAVDAPAAQEGLAAIDVATLERDPLLRPWPGAGNDDRQRGAEDQHTARLHCRV